MEAYNVWWEGFEHRVLIDRSKIDPNRIGRDRNYRLYDETGVHGGENLNYSVLLSIILGSQLSGLRYEKE